VFFLNPIIMYNLRTNKKQTNHAIFVNNNCYGKLCVL
jgi:hypothetical protein